jgi:excisionase family DNA binding protein
VPEEELISLSEAAAIAKLHPDHLRKLAQKGALRARKIGRNWVTSREAVAEYLGDAEKRSRDPFKARRDKNTR